MDLLGPRYKYRKGFLRTSHEIRPWIPRDVDRIQKEIDSFSPRTKDVFKTRAVEEGNIRKKFVQTMQQSREQKKTRG